MTAIEPLPATRHKLPLGEMFRLGLFQMGLGLMSLLMLGVLNRVLIEGIKVPATVAVLMISMHQFVAPARVWFGQLSDSRPLWGWYRTGYVWLGGMVFTSVAFLTVQAVWQLGASIPVGSWQWTPEVTAWVVLIGGLFALYGLSLSASSTPFAALLVDVADEEERPRLVGIVWSLLMVGIVLGAVLSSKLLEQARAGSPIAELKNPINTLFTIVPILVAVLAIISVAGIEKKYSIFSRDKANKEIREDQITLGKAIRVLTASGQTGLFFAFLLTMTISLFMQEPVLEPFGGAIFNMDYAQTTRLNAFWGSGTLIGLMVSGFAIIPRLGKKNTAKWGCLSVALTFLLIILSGFLASTPLLQIGMFLFGFASGITTSGGISLMLDLTATNTAGTFIGAWGLAQAMARGLAVVLGGTMLDVGKFFFPEQPTFAYSLVFFTQAMGMLLAVALLARVNVQEFRTTAQEAIAKVLASDLD
ncbi:MAG: BCD family MFS transporter [Pseudanabaenaceae cyanobacterium]